MDGVGKNQGQLMREEYDLTDKGIEQAVSCDARREQVVEGVVQQRPMK